MVSENKDPILLRASLEKLMKSIGAPDIDSTINLLEIWPELIGEELSSKISLVALNGSTLVIHVNDPAWASQISWLEAQILERIDKKIGKGVVSAVKAKTTISKEN